MSAFRSRLALALAAGAFLPAVLQAQQSNGSLSGRVTAADGVTPKAGVQVTVVEKKTNLTRSSVTDASGVWRVVALPVGAYTITFKSGSEAHTARSTVSLGVDTFTAFKWPAEAGAVVVVESAASGGVDLVNTTSAELGVNVSSEALASLPVLDRNVNTAAVLAPGVQIIQGGQVDPTKHNSTYIVSGDGQGRGTNFNVDGADNNSTDVGGAVFNVPFDAIDQFQVVTNQYKAEFGRSNAGFMNIVTKSGGNDFAGALNVQYTNQNFRARRTDEWPKLSNDQEIYSATVSGPIIKDKLFYMISMEKNDASAGQSFDPRAVQTFPSLGNSPTDTKKNTLYAKVDWNVNQNWLASFTYGRYYDTLSNEALGGPQSVSFYNSPSELGTARDSINTYGAKVTGTYGNLVWESNFHYFNYTNAISPASPGQNNGFDVQAMPDQFGYTPGNNWANGWDANAIQNTGVKRMEWKNEVTWTTGSHTVKGGVDWQQTSYPLERYFWPYPDPWLIGLSFPAVSMGQAYSSSVTAAQVAQVFAYSPVVNPATSFHTYGFYAQDDWVINPKWTVYYGGRLDWDTQLDQYQALDPIYSTIASQNPGLSGIGSQAPRTKKYFSPRLQVLFKPYGDDSLTFKLGYGKFTAVTIDNVVGFSRGLFANVNGFTPGLYTSGFGQGQTPISVGGSPMQIAGNNVVLPAALTPYNLANNVNGLASYFQNMNSQLAPAGVSTAGRSLLASNFQYPTTQTLTFGVTYQMGSHGSLDITALYSKTMNNTVYYTADNSSLPVTDNYNGQAMGDNIFLSDQTATQRQVQFKYSYTTPKQSFICTLTVANDTSSSAGSAGAFSNSAQADFYGAGSAYLWKPNPEMPAPGSQLLQGSFSYMYHFDTGTTVSLLGQWHSGKFYTVYQGYSPATGVGNATTLTNPNLPLGTAVGDWNLDMGLRIAQDFKIGPKMVLEPFVQVQNLLNNYDYGNNYYNQAVIPTGSGNPDPGMANPQLGQRMPLFQTNAPRTIAVGLRFTW